MAQIKRKKVSSKAVKGQKRENNLIKSKKFWIITSSIVLGLAILGVGIWLIVSFTTKTTTVDNPDYFGKSTEYLDVYKDKTENNKVEFNKMSYDGLLMHIDSEDPKVYVEYVFVFACNFKNLYVDNTINTGKTSGDAGYIAEDNIKAHSKLFSQLAFLQYRINKYNESEAINERVEFYVIDTSIADNLGVFSDERFGGSSENSSAVTFFLYSYGDLIRYSDEDEQKTIFGNDVTLITNTCINNAVNFMEKGNFVLETNN